MKTTIMNTNKRQEYVMQRDNQFGLEITFVVFSSYDQQEGAWDWSLILQKNGDSLSC